MRNVNIYRGAVSHLNIIFKFSPGCLFICLVQWPEQIIESDLDSASAGDAGGYCAGSADFLCRPGESGFTGGRDHSFDRAGTSSTAVSFHG
jgi:hypothetical protein